MDGGSEETDTRDATDDGSTGVDGGVGSDAVVVADVEIESFLIEYEEIGEYPPAMTVSSQQRVGVVLELRDAGETPASPQPFVQALPVAVDMVRLSVLQQPIQPPIVIRT